MLKKIPYFVFVLVLLFTFSVRELYAITLFSDDFNQLNNSKWKYQANGGEIIFNDGVMNLSSSALLFPFITNSEVKIMSNYTQATLEFRYNYGLIGYMGDGFGVGYTGTNDYPFYQFSVWNDLNSGLVFQYRDIEMSSNGGCDYSNVPLKKIIMPVDVKDYNWHVFKIEKNGGKYVVSIDSEVIYLSNDNQCIPQNIFIGNSQTGGRTDWDKLNLDYVKLYTIDPPKPKIVILPGLGASWNPEAILLGNTAPSYQWTMTPFVTNYDSLIGALEKNGLVKGQDFYVWNYDWRKPLSQIVIDFNNFVNNLNLQNGQKLDLVGHSLGGLVARVWTQDHPDLVEQTITLGSPQYGSVKAYEAWNGAKVGDNFDAASIALNVLLQLEKKNNDTMVETVRSFAPVVFDLSPTFDFLKKNGKVVSVKSSEYLNSKNNSVSAISNLLTTVNGQGVQTKEWINLGDQSIIDKILGQWEDGEPISYSYGIGDGTVLKKSALILGSGTTEFDSDHGNLVNKSVNWVLGKLSLGTTVSIVVNNYPTKQAIFYLGSPATMTVNCGGTERSDNSGWVIMENQDSGNCTIKLVGKDGGGAYHLVVGDNNGWKYVEGTITNGQKQTLKVNSDDLCWQMLKWDFQKIGVKDGMGNIDKKDISKTIDSYMVFRGKNENYKFSEEILDNLKCVLDGKKVEAKDLNSTRVMAIYGRSLADIYIKLMSIRGKKINYSEAIDYDQANSLIGDGSYGASFLANKLFGIMGK
jgi:pimeloyl-ACP methyl ester carboxylesterase